MHHSHTKAQHIPIKMAQEEMKFFLLAWNFFFLLSIFLLSQHSFIYNWVFCFKSHTETLSPEVH